MRQENHAGSRDSRGAQQTGREGLGHRVLPSFSQSFKIKMAAAVGVHLGCTSASLAIYKVQNQFL